MFMSTIIPKDKPVHFLSWLYHRLKIKYKEEKIILDRLADIIHNYAIINQTINLRYIDEICSKHFIQFEMDEAYGFKEEFKNTLRCLVIDVIKDIGAKYSECNSEFRQNIDLNIELPTI